MNSGGDTIRHKILHHCVVTCSDRTGTGGPRTADHSCRSTYSFFHCFWCSYSLPQFWSGTLLLTQPGTSGGTPSLRVKLCVYYPLWLVSFKTFLPSGTASPFVHTVGLHPYSDRTPYTSARTSPGPSVDVSVGPTTRGSWKIRVWILNSEQDPNHSQRTPQNTSFRLLD